MSLITPPQVSIRDLALRSLDQLPPFSPVLNQLMASLADEDVPFSKVAATIERDTALSGNVLRLVNSCLYGRRGEISSIRAAVAMLGINKLRNYLLGLSVARLWAKVRTPPGWDMARFNRHSVAVAIWADILVQHVPAQYPEGAFVAGLLHDTGRLLLAVALPAETGEIMAAYEAGGRTLEECEFAALDLTHATLSEAALAKWNLPEPIQRAALYHHHSLDDPAAQAAAHLPLSAIIHSADALANSAGHCVLHEDFRQAPAAERTLTQLGLDPLQQQLLSDFDIEFHAVRSAL